MLPLIIQLLTGAVGGNLAGKILKNLDMGVLLNSIVGILGGGLGGQILGMLGITAGPSGALDLTSIVQSVASGCVGGGGLMAIIGLIKSVIAKK